MTRRDADAEHADGVCKLAFSLTQSSATTLDVAPGTRTQTASTHTAGGDTLAVIVAGGAGTRFGDARGKQYVHLCGLPLLCWSILAFDRAPAVAGIVVVCPVGRVGETRATVLAPLTLRTPVALAEGGATRQSSVAAGLAAGASLAADRGSAFSLVAVHDGARPLVTPSTIERVVATVRADATLAGAIAAAPVTDTLKLAEDGIVVATPDRAFYWAAMTPQVFRTDVLHSAHAAASADGVVATDDAALVERAGGRVRCVATPRDNLKITVADDLAAAECVLRRRLARDGTFAGCDE